ncbi:MAG: Histidine kinase [Ramlibacter sp.]|nr:Histidine kinase [Ramlibacter sp.]
MSIRTRLLLLALLVTLLAASFVSRRFVQERHHDIAIVAGRLAALAASVSNTLGERIQGTEQLHFGLARARDLDTRDRGACSAFLSQVRDKYPQYTGILTIDPDGKLFCDSLNTGRSLDLTDRDYFRRARVAHDSVSMEPVFGRLSNMAVLQIAYPVRGESGELKFVLLASLNLQQLAQDRLKIALMPGAEVVLLDHGGVVLASAGGPAGRRRPGTSVAGSPLMQFTGQASGARMGELPNPDGSIQVWAVADPLQVREAAVHVLVGYPKELLVAAANRQLVEAMAILAVAAMLAFFGVWIFVEMAIRRPIATIADMVTRLGRNESDARIPGPHPRGELGVLMDVLNQSAEAQQAQRAAVDDLNARLRDGQRLESIGQLTGGVAHDFNNLLTVIMGNAEVLQARLRDDPALEGLAAMVLDAAERGAELTQRLLAFARRQVLEPQSIDINQRIDGLDALLSRTIGAHIQIRFSRAAGLWPALVDPAQLDNSLLNLCLNSRDAMPRGGVLSIETANASRSAEYAVLNPDVCAGDYVMLAVSDTGTGIDPRVLGRVFEPFFTTKEQGKGTGLGMAMIHGFVKQSGGHITLDSELGQGTCVRLYFPRAPTAAPRPQLPAAGSGATGGSETILLVEDDAQVRRYACEQLNSLGYRVIEAPHGLQALDIIRSGLRFDLLFTDVVMPGMSGRELVERAKDLLPALKVLYTSGYSETTLLQHGRVEEGMHLLTKPYRREELAHRIRAVLEASDPA